MAIRFVYFDLGNVLIRFSIQRMLFQLAEATERPEADVRATLFDDKNYFKYEKGDVSAREYFEACCERLGVSVDPEDFAKASNDIFWVNEPMLPVVRRLAKLNFPRGILSNTNPLHWRYIETAFPRIWGYFPSCKIASFAVKAVKPFPEIYEIALKAAQEDIPDLRPDEILFVDDAEENADAAAKFGFQTIHYTDHAVFLEKMKQFGLPVPE